jgi:hypothetical protein
MGQDGNARNEALRGLLSALWSFLQHPAVHLHTAVDAGLVAVEENIASVEHRLEEDFERVVHSRVAGIHARLEAVKKRVVEDLKRELHRILLVVMLLVAGAVLALIGGVFGLMAAWTELRELIGSVGASLVLAAVFVVASLIVLGMLRSVLHRSPKEVS